MEKLIAIGPQDRSESVRKALSAVLDSSAGIDLVVIIALNKDGTQFLKTSAGDTHEKCFLKCFFDQWALGWFKE